MLPGIDGFEVVKKMRIAGHDTPVLILSGITRAPDKVTGLKLGADDYLTKPFEPSELIARIEAVVRRKRIIWNSPLCVGPVTLHQGNREVSVDGKPIHVTPTEFTVLEALALGKGMPLTKESLMRHIYGGIDEPDAQTIDVLVCKLRRKLNEAGVSGFIETVLGTRLHGFLANGIPGTACSEYAPAGAGLRSEWWTHSFCGQQLEQPMRL